MTELTINNRSGMKLDSLMDSLNEFYPYAKKKLGFDQDASINFISDPENSEKLLGKTAYYNPAEFSVTIYVDKRHPKDIMRSISHELVHHAQNCRGDLSDLSIAGEQGYAQKDSHLREMEKEAYLKGNMNWRDFEDGVKAGNNNADTIYERVVKNWGYGMLKESDTRYQRIIKSKHGTMKTRINKTGANKTKAAPFNKGSSSERATSAPPSAGAALEENGDFKIMNNKMVEEVVKNVLKRMKLEEAEVEEVEEKNEGYTGSIEDATSEDAKAEILQAVEMLKQMGVDVPPDIQARIEQMLGDPSFADAFGKVKSDALSGVDVGDPDYTGGLEENCDGDEEEKEGDLHESKKTLKYKLKKARRHNDKKEARRIKKHLNESKTLKEALIKRKSNINSRLMEKWFKTRE
tara:strand:+ start:3890 stop:5107 length:1218 start_codon:yes stop_codon:yes gene_type:complete